MGLIGRKGSGPRPSMMARGTRPAISHNTLKADVWCDSGPPQDANTRRLPRRSGSAKDHDLLKVETGFYKGPHLDAFVSTDAHARGPL